MIPAVWRVCGEREHMQTTVSCRCVIRTSGWREEGTFFRSNDSRGLSPAGLLRGAHGVHAVDSPDARVEARPMLSALIDRRL